MENLYKIGILGAGFISEYHLRALKHNNRSFVKAVCDANFDKAKNVSEKYEIPLSFESIDELLKCGLDAVHILLPPDMHAKTAKLFLEEGIHVFLEKPMALESSECQVLIELANSKKVKLGINHNFLFLPSYEKFKHHLNENAFGYLDQITINWLYPLNSFQKGPFNQWAFANPKNLFFEIGSHLAAFALDLVNDLEIVHMDYSKPIKLPGGYKVYRKWHVHGQNRNGISVNINLSVLPGFNDRSIKLRGHGGIAQIDMDRDTYTFLHEPGYGMTLNNFLINGSNAIQLLGSGLSNLCKSIKCTLAKTTGENPFSDSIQKSIDCFYKSLSTNLDHRISGTFASKVIKLCEDITINLSPVDQQIESHITHHKSLKMSSKPKILVLGGTGFIGKELVKSLVEAGHSVRLVTRSIQHGILRVENLPVDLIEGELNDLDFMNEALNGIDVVYHLARSYGKNWQEYYNNDVLVTKNIANLSLKRNIRRFIYTGTIDSYYSGDPNEIINSETQLDPLIHMRNHYARAKAETEYVLMQMHKTYDLPIVILRPGIVIGKGCPPSHLGIGMFHSDSKVQFWGNGKNKLPLVLVDDVAKALFLSLDKPDIEGQSFLITDSPLISAREYVDHLSKFIGLDIRSSPVPIWKYFLSDFFKESIKHMIRHPNRRKPRYRDWKSRTHKATYDNTMAKETLGWEPVGNRDLMVNYGIREAARSFFR